MNKKLKRDVIYSSIISSLIILIIILTILLFIDTDKERDQNIINQEIEQINNTVSDSIKLIDKERIDRYNADRSETNKFFWTKEEADTIYFRKIRNLLIWRDIEIKKIK